MTCDLVVTGGPVLVSTGQPADAGVASLARALPADQPRFPRFEA